MRFHPTGSLAVLALAVTVASTASARDGQERDDYRNPGAPGFERIASFANYRNNAVPSDETVSEIVAAAHGGRTLIYTDSPLEEVGLVDISNPYAPEGLGKLPMPGEPTSVAVWQDKFALVGVDTSESLTQTSGQLLVIDLDSGRTVRSVELGGQPDSVTVSPDGRYVAVAIENERDEEICVGGANSGAPVPEDGPEEPGDISEDECEEAGGAVGVLPQTVPEIGNPPGFLAVVDIRDGWTVTAVDLTGLAGYAPEDPEPEFVDINGDNIAAVSLQENNHIVLVDLRSKTVVKHFDAGTVTLIGVDAEEDGVISATQTIENVAREPDALTWMPGACGWKDGIATANEGDLFGGSRGFTVFCPGGRVAYDSGSLIEQVAVAHGHYPEDRSENKGSEPEAIAYGRYGRRDYLFVGSERGSFVAVFEARRHAPPRFRQLLPAPLGPEGVLAIPERGLLVVSGEEDDPEFGVRSTMMIYRLGHRRGSYPQIVSEDGIGWAALSGMTAVPGKRDTLLAVWDSYFDESHILRIDTSDRPAVITEAVAISGGSGDYDPEGIAVAPDGTLWIASEGGDPGERPNLLVQTDAMGNVLNEVGLPPAIEACRAASADDGNLGNGFEGVAVLPGKHGSYRLLVAQQLPWYYTTPECVDLDDEPGFTRIWIYDPAGESWGHMAYELAARPGNASWVGLSEISEARGGDYVVIERDNRTGDFAALKTLVRINVKAAADGVITADDKAVYDLLEDLTDSNGWITDKPEGVAVDGRGHLYLVTDNDGVEDWSGETWFLELGNYRKLFKGDRRGPWKWH